MTRAKKELCITYSRSDWEGREQEKSMFITELPAETLTHLDTESFEKSHIQDLSFFLLPSKNERTIYDPTFIKDLFMRKGLTVTALNNYLSCPVKYFYRNLVQIPSGYSAHMQYGNEIHGALEKFFIESKRSEQLGSRDRLIELFEAEMLYSTMRESDKKKYLNKGKVSLAAWYEARRDDLLFNVATEQKIRKDFQLSSGERLRLNGVLDKIEYLENETEGLINVVDYKTGKAYSKKSKEQKADLERQLTFYHVLLEGYRDDAYRISETVLEFIEPNEKGQIERVSISIDEDKVVELKQVIDTTVSKIITGDFLDNGCHKKDCEWCELHATIAKK
jgi:DNA helicase-2/ATP-dependent DNA helicase PcrA